MRTMNKVFALGLVLLLASALAFAVPAFAAHGDDSAVSVVSVDSAVSVVSPDPADSADSANSTDSKEMPNQVQLTAKQQKELASLYKDILKKEHKVIATYVKYGVLTKEQGKMITDHLDMRFKKLEQNGFVPKWGKQQHQHHKHKKGEQGHHGKHGHQGHHGHKGHHHDHHQQRDKTE